MELKCKVQNYDWGKIGTKSKVAQLVSSADPSIIIEANVPYAELWLGTHPNGQSLIIDRNILLAEYIKDNIDSIGPDVRRKFGTSVPFLLKILSIRKALSIQAHPNKELAENLHNNFPDIYKDPNHKPELAIALTPFEALCGFRPLLEVKGFLQKLPELKEMLSQEAVQAVMSLNEQGDNAKTALKDLFCSLMTTDKDLVVKGLQNLLTRLKIQDEVIRSALMYPLITKLHEDFPGDVGCWAPYLLNYIQLKPGDAIYLASNLPHAYLSGDCIECMACSDNVVRAGLTPKLIDVPTLVEMLDYSSYTRDQLLFRPQLEDENSCVWRPPVPDFAVVKMKVEGGDSYNTRLRNSPSLLLVVGGEGEACDSEPISVRPGVAIFLKASRQLTLTPKPESYLEVYQAICNV